MGRKLNWVSAIDPRNKTTLEELKCKLYNFYNNQVYYKSIDFTSSNWSNAELLHYRAIIDRVITSDNILEIGCGNANILKHYPALVPFYTGIDFSEKLMKANQKKFPGAKFLTINSSNELPVKSNFYDVVFSVFVLEHTIYPHIFLNECVRVLKKNGFLIILTPDFLGKSKMTSQRVGLSYGSGREKIKKGKYLDALITGYDNKIKLPLYSTYLRMLCIVKPRFFINVNPTFLFDDFYPDADAVYLTYEKEIKKYLSDRIFFLKHDKKLKNYLNKIKVILLIGRKI